MENRQRLEFLEGVIGFSGARGTDLGPQFALPLRVTGHAVQGVAHGVSGGVRGGEDGIGDFQADDVVGQGLNAVCGVAGHHLCDDGRVVRVPAESLDAVLRRIVTVLAVSWLLNSEVLLSLLVLTS